MNLNNPKPLATSKIQIKQHVPIGSIRKGPHAIERSLVPDEVVIKHIDSKRQAAKLDHKTSINIKSLIKAFWDEKNYNQHTIGYNKVSISEGSKPLFQRDDIVVNSDSITNTVNAQNDKQVLVGNKNHTGDISNHWRKERHDSTDSSSPERYRKYNNKQNNESEGGPSERITRRTKTTKPSSDDKHTVRRDVSPPPNRRQRTPEKIPYFIDQVRERDRIRRKYGSTKNKSPPASAKYRRRRSGSRSRSHSRDSIGIKQHSQTRRTHFRRSISMDRYKGDNTKRERGKSHTDSSLGRTSRHYRHRSEDRDKNSRRHRSSRTHSRSRTRSRERSSRIGTQSGERHKHRHSDHDGASNEDVNQRNLPQPQIITIPVPVPADFMNYAYPTWPTPTQWAPQPSRYGAPSYHMPNFLPGVLPPLRQPMPPYGLPPQPLRYGGPGFRPPPQYGASRPWRPNFRSKNS